jgi:hypothetical protein
MINDPSQPSRSLMEEISRGLQPVTPSPTPLRRTLGIVPFAALASLAILAVIGQRKDAVAIGFLMTWGASAIQFGFGMLLLWIAAREGTPSQRLSQKVVRSAVAATILVFVVVALRTFAESPTLIPAGLPAWRVGLFCGAGATVAGSLLVVSFTSLFRQSLTAHPALTGGLYGAGAGVTVNSGWRLACPISTPGHSLVAHGIAIILTVILGAAVGHVIAQQERGLRFVRRR